MRKVKTASGATAVQIVHKTGSRRDGIDHVGSAHTDADLHVLLATAHRQLAGDQPELDLRAPDIVGYLFEFLLVNE